MGVDFGRRRINSRKKKKKKKKRKKENLPSLQMDRNEPHFDLMNFSFYVK
jgi:hypothetical protein